MDDSSIPVTNAEFIQHHSDTYSLELSVIRPEGVDEQAVEDIWGQIKFSCSALGARIKCCSTRPSLRMMGIFSVHTEMRKINNASTTLKFVAQIQNVN